MEWCDNELPSEITPCKRIRFSRDINEQENSPKIDLYAKELKNGKGKFLVDTGAELSIIHKGKLKNNASVNTKNKFILCGIGGKTVTTLGEILLTINGSLYSFQLVPDDLRLSEDGILGMNFLKDGSIHLKRKEIEHSIGIFPFIPENKNINLQIKARMKQIVKVPVQNPEIKEGYLPLVDLGPGIFMGEVLVKVKEKKITLFCINTTTRDTLLSFPPLTLEKFEILNSAAESVKKKLNLKCSNAKEDRLSLLIDALDLSNLNKEERGSLLTTIFKYPQQFYLKNDRLGYTTVLRHRIQLTDEKPVSKKGYRYPPIHREVIRKEVTDLLENKEIFPSDSPYNSPVWVVPKKADPQGNKRWRMVIDYRALNEKTIGDAYPLPNVIDILDQLGERNILLFLILPLVFTRLKLNLMTVIKPLFPPLSVIMNLIECLSGWKMHQQLFKE